MLLHQRAYGGAFRQLLDATSGARGDLVEDPVERFFAEERIPYIRTGTHNQAAIEERLGLTVRPAPDFVIFDNRNDLPPMAFLERLSGLMNVDGRLLFSSEIRFTEACKRYQRNEADLTVELIGPGITDVRMRF